MFTTKRELYTLLSLRTDKGQYALAITVVFTVAARDLLMPARVGHCKQYVCYSRTYSAMSVSIDKSTVHRVVHCIHVKATAIRAHL